MFSGHTRWLQASNIPSGLTSTQYDTKQILHASVLDIKVYYYPRNAIFHEAAGRVEYCHSKGSNKPHIQHSKSAIFVLLYSLHLHTKPCQVYEDRNEAFF